MFLRKIEGMKIREKLRFGYSLVIFMVVIIAVFSGIGLFFVQDKMNDYINGTQAADTAVKQCRINMNAAARNIREMTLNDNRDADQDYREKVEKYARLRNQDIDILYISAKTGEGIEALADWIVAQAEVWRGTEM